jgi:hypothetical protein
MDEWTGVESIIEDFERAWRAGRRPEIGEFLSRVGDSGGRRRLLLELVCVDLEYAYRLLICIFCTRGSVIQCGRPAGHPSNKDPSP